VDHGRARIYAHVVEAWKSTLTGRSKAIFEASA
jgi:hypothetical protein